MISTNDDGTITFAGRRLDGMEVANLVTALLGAMSQATERAGQMDSAKSTDHGQAFHAIKPNMVQLREADGAPDPILTLVFGNAHVGIILPREVMRDLSRGVLTNLPPDPAAH